MNGYKPLPSYNPLPLLRLADGRSAEEWMADVDTKHGIVPAGDVIECDYQVFDGERWQTVTGGRFDEWWMEKVVR